MFWMVFAALATMAIETPAEPISNTILATYQGGSVSRADLDSWRRFSGADLDLPPHRVELRRIAVFRLSPSVLESSGVASSRAYVVERRQFERELVVRELERRLLEESRPTEEEIRVRYEADRERLHRPKRWMMRNILVSVPPGATAVVRRDARVRAESILAELAQGASFEDLAAEYSDSATAVRGGRMGFVSLDQLAPGFRDVVAGLDVDEVSAVIETDDGFTLVWCTGILPAGAPKLENIRDRINSTILREQFSALSEEVEARVRSTVSVEPVSESWLAMDPPTRTAFVLRMASGEELKSISLDEYLHFIQSRQPDTEPTNLTDAEHLELVDELAMEVGLAQEAEHLGYLDGEEYRRSLEWNLGFFAAHYLFRQRVEPGLVTDEEIAEFYAKHRPTMVRQAASLLRVVEIVLDDSTPRDVVVRGELAVREIRSGSLGFEDASAFIDPSGGFAQNRTLGWLDDDALFLLGAGPHAAARTLAAGDTSELVQEGPKLMILHCDETREASTMSLEEARPGIVRSIERNEQTAAKRRFEGEILRAADFKIVGSDVVPPRMDDDGRDGSGS